MFLTYYLLAESVRVPASTAIVKDVVVPLLCALIAAGVVVAGYMREGQKSRAEARRLRFLNAESVFTEIFYASALAKLIVFGSSTPEHYAELRRSYDRVAEMLLTQPEIGSRLRASATFANVGADDRIFVLLAEARVRVARSNMSLADLNVVYIALLTLTFLYQTETERAASDSWRALSALCNGSSLQHLLIARDTRSLRGNGAP